MARPRSDIQPRIVAAARARFLAEGVDGASLREIARDAKTNVGMVVYYFPTKDDLFLSVVEEVYAKLLADLTAILGANGTARHRLRGAFVRLGAASELELQVIRLIAREALSSSKRLRRILARFMRGHIPLVVATVADGIRSGEFDPAIPAPVILVAVLGLGPLPQIARRALPVFSSLPEAERLADVSIELLFRAVGAARAGPRKRGSANPAPPRARIARHPRERVRRPR